MSKQQTAAMMHEAVDQALDKKRSELSAHKAELYPETVRYLTLVQIDNLWAQQLEVGPWECGADYRLMMGLGGPSPLTVY